MCRLLGPSVHQVHSELVHLLKDDSLDVLAALVDRLPDTLETFVTHGVLGPTAKVSHRRTDVKALRRKNITLRKCTTRTLSDLPSVLLSYC